MGKLGFEASHQHVLPTQAPGLPEPQFPYLENGNNNSELLSGRLWRTEQDNLCGCVPWKGCPSISWFCSHLSLYLLPRTKLRVLTPSREGVPTSVPGIG